MNGPFHTERDTLVALLDLLHGPPAYDQPVSLLVAAGLLPLGRFAPRGNRVATTRRPSFTTAMRVVDRIHRHAPNRRRLAEPALPTGLAQADVLLVRVRHGADRRH